MTEIRPGERIGVLGLARSGVAASRLALKQGAEVYASDLSRNEATEAAAVQLRALGADVDTGVHDLEKLAACSRIVLSPGIPLTAKILSAPGIAGIPVVPEIEFAFHELSAPVVTVTGTNGKTTVTALIAHLLRTAGIDAEAGGNIGVALSELALREPQPAVAVVEASSFQLGATTDFACSVGVLTNLAPDHLDWYGSVEEYYADKAKMYRGASPRSRWVLNGEDEEALALPGDAPGERYVVRIESPLEPGERGGYLSADGWLTLRPDSENHRILASSELKIRGPHNVANALFAALAAYLVGAPIDRLAEGLRSFSPIPHRLEPVAEKNGVLWINDSKATNIASTLVAIRGMDRPTVLLLGGRHKGEPYRKLIPRMEGRVKQVIAYGEAADQVVADLGGAIPVEKVEGRFEVVLARAAAHAESGDTVLLSPACSSYDMFESYEHRGREFRRIVEEELG
ncbi:MAG: UDP-N-acetylmuramoyl-L-alanine--D-glutamate ligase [Gemmatimonadota bacterium]|jgi:UDP-N-acetylmuramoylalanine--D-glutamate ligase|nr:UDP-N-acetylmuramoyl-L-alanine--D-glutamate ligase [Gemmatimonadota bacterium]